MTPAPEGAVERPLRLQGHLRRRVREPAHELPDPAVPDPAFDTERALPDGGEELLGGKHLGHALCHPEPLQSRPGEHQCIDLPPIELPEPGAHVAPDVDELHVRAQRQELTAPAHTGRAHPRPGRQARESTRPRWRHQDIQRTGPLENRPDVQSLGQLRRHVLHGVNREVGSSLEQGLLELLHEEALAPQGLKGAIQEPVAARGHLHELTDELRFRLLQAPGHVPRLPQGQRARAGGDSQQGPAGRLGGAHGHGSMWGQGPDAGFTGDFPNRRREGMRFSEPQGSRLQPVPQVNPEIES